MFRQLGPEPELEPIRAKASLEKNQGHISLGALFVH